MSSKGHLLLISPLKTGSGNHSTIQRISSYLETAGYVCTIRDPSEFESKAELKQYVKSKRIILVIALHAYKSGSLLSANIPYILIFGGTDLNEFSRNEEKVKVMTKAVIAARYLVTFNGAMLDKAFDIWPSLERQRTCIIRQGVATNPSEFSLKDKLYDMGKITKDQFFQAKIFLFVGGIRRVKDPMFLVDTFTDWQKEFSDVLYVILGPVMDTAYHEELLSKIQRESGVIYLNELSLEDTHACMKQSFSLVNSSVSEGMAAVILEAMDVGVPVLARNNEGNCSLISSGKTGFLFSSPEEFKEKANILLNDSKLYHSISEEAKRYVTSYHNPEQERARYLDIVRDYDWE